MVQPDNLAGNPSINDGVESTEERKRRLGRLRQQKRRKLLSVEQKILENDQARLRMKGLQKEAKLKKKVHNYSLPPINIKAPEQEAMAADKERIATILATNEFPAVDWETAKVQLEANVSKLLRQSATKIDFLNLDEMIDTISGEPVTSPIDIDHRMRRNSSMGTVLHGSHLVYVATFTPEVCGRITELAVSSTGLSYCISKDAITGLMEVANSDSMQANEPAVYTANFGATVRNQKPTTKKAITSDIVRAYDYAVGASRYGRVTTPSSLETSLAEAVSFMYHANFYSKFLDPSLPKEDQWYSERSNGKGSRIPRFSKNGKNFWNRGQMMLPCPRKTSLPIASNHYQVVAAKTESRIRTLSEWLLANVFAPSLPYSSSAFLAQQNMQRACHYSETANSQPLPIKTLCRPLPKGAIGVQRVKEMHDDGNAAIIPGVWTSLVGDETVVLQFSGLHWDVYFRTTTRRFCWFYGWIGHKTKVLNDSSVVAKGKMNKVQRVHHSAFNKPDLEHVALALFSDDYMKQVVDSYKP